MTTASGSEKTPLVEVFCQDVVQQTSSHWASVVEHLETRLAPVEATVAQSPEFAACVLEQASFFSTADFLWQGREVIRQATRAETGAMAEGGVRVAVADTDFEMPMVGMVSVGLQQPTLSRAVDPYGYSERSNRYDQLWQEFLAGLKSRFNRRAVEQQVAKNTN